MRYILLLIAILVIAGCQGAPPQDTAEETKPTAEAMEESEEKSDKPKEASKVMDKLSKIFSGGKGVKCVYTINQEGFTGKATSWTTKDHSRVTLTGSEDMDVIVTPTESLINSDTMRQGPFQGCEWVLIENTEMEPPEMDEEQTLDEGVAEARLVYPDIVCTEESIPASKFQAQGKVCDMDQMIGDLATGFDPSAYT